jgi:hypothetical protein
VAPKLRRAGFSCVVSGIAGLLLAWLGRREAGLARSLEAVRGRAGRGQGGQNRAPRWAGLMALDPYISRLLLPEPVDPVRVDAMAAVLEKWFSDGDALRGSGRRAFRGGREQIQHASLLSWKP